MRLGTGPIGLEEVVQSESMSSAVIGGILGVESAEEWVMKPEAQCSMPVAQCIILNAAKLIPAVDWIQMVEV